ncbi:uncharacterized [Tachysurus ichikawai]
MQSAPQLSLAIGAKCLQDVDEDLMCKVNLSKATVSPQWMSGTSMTLAILLRAAYMGDRISLSESSWCQCREKKS